MKSDRTRPGTVDRLRARTFMDSVLSTVFWAAIGILVIGGLFVAIDKVHGQDGPCLMPPFPGDDSVAAVTADQVQAKISPELWETMRGAFPGQVSPLHLNQGLDEPGDGIDMQGHVRRLRAGKVGRPAVGGWWERTKAVFTGEYPEAVPDSAPKPFNVLVVKVGFKPTPQDTTPTIIPTIFNPDSMFFGDVGHTVNEFYGIASQGQIRFTTEHWPADVGWIIAPKAKSYYVNNNYGFGGYPYNSQKLCEDVIDLLDPLVDFSIYDNDGNGYVDGLILCQAGRGAELTSDTTDFWSHKWGITPRLRDGVYISTYTVQPSYWARPGDMTIGVYAHETGHLFGLPDLYDLDNSSRGLGKWSLMAGGSWNGTRGNRPAPMGPWERFKLGFAEPITIDHSPERVTLGFMDILKVSATPQEGPFAFFAEYHDQINGNYYDGGLPHSGLVIEIVDETKPSNSKEWWPRKAADQHYMVAIAQPDSAWHLEHNTNSGDPGDMWPWFMGGGAGNYRRSFQPLWYDGTDPGVTLDSIAVATDRRSVSLTLRREWIVPGCTCPHYADIDGNGVLDYSDLMVGYAIVFFGAEGVTDDGCPLSRADIDQNGFIDATDMAFLGDHLAGAWQLGDPCVVN